MSVYKNGNTIVEIREDGTKLRYTPDSEKAAPLYPESIDLKITNMCTMGCTMCHEQSTPHGKHGDLHHQLLDSLHPYTELAIGGGDPMSNPYLEPFLIKMKNKNVICNITVHWFSFMKHRGTLTRWANQGLIHGIGISINEKVPTETIDYICNFKNAVVHTIIGIANEDVYKQLADKNLNILLLGYKTFGRGIRYRTKEAYNIDINTVWLKENILKFTDHFRAVCFDNLAIEQLDLKTKMSPEMFNQMYMGGDGTFTMYVDLVENKYAVSSTSIDRYNINSNNIDDLFANVRNISNAN